MARQPVARSSKSTAEGKGRAGQAPACLQLSPSQLKDLRDALKKGRKVVDDRGAIGVSYEVEGQKRGARSYLVKAD